MCKMYKTCSFHGLTRNVETALYFIQCKAALYDNTSPTWDIFSLEVSVKTVNVMCCWIILAQKVNSRYRSETLLKQISLQVFLNYCSNILVVGFVYFLSDFSRSKSSNLEAFRKKDLFLKNVRMQRKTVVPESSFEVAECFKKETPAQVFLCKFHKVFKKCFVEAMFCRTYTKVCFWNS